MATKVILDIKDLPKNTTWRNIFIFILSCPSQIFFLKVNRVDLSIHVYLKYVHFPPFDNGRNFIIRKMENMQPRWESLQKCSQGGTGADRALPRAGLFSEVYSLREMGFDLSLDVYHMLCPFCLKAQWPGLKSTFGQH